MKLYRLLFALMPLMCACVHAQQIVVNPCTVNSSGACVANPVTSIILAPATQTSVVGNVTTYTASAQTVTPTGTPTNVTSECVFSSSNTSVATIQGNTAVGQGAGTTVIMATCGAPGTTQLTATASLTVLGPPQITNPACSSQPCALTQGTIGSAYSFAFQAVGGVLPYNWTVSVGSLPSGLSLGNSSTLCGTSTNCLLSGTPSGSTGTTTWAMQVCDSIHDCQTVQVSLTTVSSSTTPAGDPVLPSVWVNAYEGDSAIASPTYTATFPNTWSCGSSNYGPYTANSQSSLNTFLANIEACRTNNGGTPNILGIIPAGSVFSGSTTIVFPQTNTTTATGWIYIRSSADSSLPDHQTVCSHGQEDNVSYIISASQQVTQPGLDNVDCAGDAMTYQLGATVTSVPAGSFTFANGTTVNTSSYNDAQYMWTVENTSTANNPVFALCSPTATSGLNPPPCGGSTNIAPDHLVIEDGKFELGPGVKSVSYLLQIIASVTGLSSTSQLATHVHLRKDFATGDWSSLTTGANAIQAAFSLDCIYCSLTDSAVTNALYPAGEGHGVQIVYGDQLKISHNWIEGSSIGLICGGSSVTMPIAGFVPCQDTQIDRNRFTFPYAWLGVNNIPSGNTNWSGSSILRKNSFEMKSAQRLVLVGNIFENVDKSGAQNGVVGPEFDVRNTSAGNFGSNYQTTIQDDYVRGNISRNGCAGFAAGFHSAGASNGGGVAVGMHNIWFYNNLWYNVSNTNTFGASGCSGTGDNGLEITSFASTWEVSLTENSAGTAATAILVCTPIISGNCPAGPLPIGYQQSPFVPNQDPVSIYGCTLTDSNGHTFNTPANPLFSSPSTALGPVVTAAVNNYPTTVTVTFPFSGVTPSFTDGSGSCILSAIQGYARNWKFTHNTLVTDPVGKAFYYGSGLATGAVFGLNGLMRDDIFVGAGLQSSTTEGTKTEQYIWDALNTLSFDHLVFPTRTASNYTEYGNNPNYPDAAGCTGNGCSPPTSIHFPSAPNCTTAQETFQNPACVGFQVAGNATSMPILASDYHLFALQSEPGNVCVTVSGLQVCPSYYATGNPGAASDGFDMGVNLTNSGQSGLPTVDSDQTTTTFVCPYACGSPGPYQD